MSGGDAGGMGRSHCMGCSITISCLPFDPYLPGDNVLFVVVLSNRLT